MRIYLFDQKPDIKEGNIIIWPPLTITNFCFNLLKGQNRSGYTCFNWAHLRCGDLFIIAFIGPKRPNRSHHRIELSTLFIRRIAVCSLLSSFKLKALFPRYSFPLTEQTNNLIKSVKNFNMRSTIIV